ncbi:MAG: hypothetical protein ABI743_05490 [bacterium]
MPERAPREIPMTLVWALYVWAATHWLAAWFVPVAIANPLMQVAADSDASLSGLMLLAFKIKEFMYLYGLALFPLIFIVAIAGSYQCVLATTDPNRRRGVVVLCVIWIILALPVQVILVAQVRQLLAGGVR